MSLPVLDASLFLTGTEGERQEFARDLCESFTKHGFSKIANHGFSDDLVAQVFEWNKRFFEISTQAKQAIAHPPGPTPQRGWSAVGSENSSKLYGNLSGNSSMTDMSDAREHFDQGAPDDETNRWPSEDELPGFRQFMGDFYNRCETFSLHLLSALELALQLPQGSFVTKCTGKASELRLLHYPPISTRDIQKGKVSRIWPHFDLGVITLLFQDHVGGLEIQERASPAPDTFIAVGCERRSDMVVNISETLQRWTNDRLPAGLHRVTTPRGMVDGMIPERYTVAYFCKADRNARVGTLPPFCVGKLRKYEDMTALEYHQQRLAAAYA